MKNWMKGWLDPSAGMSLNRDTIVLQLAFLVMCALGLLGPIANWAHFGGLGVGIVIGAFLPLYRRLLRQMR